MAVQIEGTPTTVGTTSTTALSVPVPAGAKSGELLVVCLRAQATSATDYTAPAGWQRIGPAFQPSQSNIRVTDMWVYPITGAPPASPVVFTPPSSPGRQAAVMARVSGVDLADPVAASTGYAISSTSGATSLDVPGYQVSGSSLSLMVVGITQTSGNSTNSSVSPAAGTALVAKAVQGVEASESHDTVYLWSLPGGNSPSHTVTWGATSARCAFKVALRDAPVAPATTPGVSRWDSTTEQPVLLRRWDGTTEQPITTSPVVAPGSTTLAGLTGRQPFWIAHRGGSRSWPEMTKRAYDLAVAYGMRALEVSVHRSSDGVFVCNHDATTSRCDQNLTIANTDWATLSTLRVLPNATDNTNQPSAPFTRLETVLDAYAGSHVIFLEDKSYRNQTALLNLVKAYPDYQQHFVWKLSGGSNDAQIKLGTDLGLRTWGYWFTGFDPSSFPALAARFDYIGCDMNFTPAEWAAARAVGRPMIGHIVQTQTQVDTVLREGCVGVMLAAPRTLYRLNLTR